MLDLFFNNSGEARQEPAQPAAARPPETAPQSGDSSDQREGAVFVGREAELRRLHAALDRAMAGKGSPIFVTGEPGAGKSTLMHRFFREAQERYPDAIVAIGECNSRSGPIDNCLPWKEILLVLTGNLDGKLAKQAGSTNSVRQIGRLAANTAGVITDLAPDLIGTLIPGSLLLVRAGQRLVQRAGWVDTLSKITQAPANELGQAAVQQVDALRLFESYQRLLTTLARQNKLILGIDDLHWADPTTISMLFHLARAVQNIPVLIVGNYRSNELAATSAGEPSQLESVVSTLQRYYGDIVVNLDFVDPGTALESEAGKSELLAARAFVDAYLAANFKPHRLSGGFVNLLLERSNANPLFLGELLASLVEEKLLLRDETGTWVLVKELTGADFPARVESIVRERIDRLPVDRRDLLLIAAVEGREFTAQMLSKVKRLPELELLKILVRELWHDHALVRERGIDDSGSLPLTIYGFRSTSIQQYLYQSLSEGEKMVLHRLVGEALEDLYGKRADAFATALASHFEVARDRVRVTRYALLAAREQLNRDGSAEARDWAEKALSAAQSEALAAHPARARAISAAHELIGDIAERQAQYEDAAASYEAALAVLPDLERRILAAEPESAAAGVAAAAESARGASSSAPTANQPVAIERGAAPLLAGRAPVSPLPARDPLEVAFARLQRKLGATHGRRNDYAKARAAYDAATAALALASPDDVAAIYERGLLFIDSGRLADVEGRPEDALRLFDAGLDALDADELRWGSAIATLLSYKGRVLAKQGRLDEAREQYSRAVQLYEERNDRRGLANCETSLGIMAGLDCDWQAALEHFSRSGAALALVNDRYGLAMLANAQGSAYADMSRYQEAAATFRNGARLAEEIGALAVRALNLLGLARAALDLGDPDSARARLDDVLAIMGPDNRGISGILTVIYRGRLALDAGDYAAAALVLESALAMAEELDFREGEIEARLQLALARLGLGEVDLAEQLGGDAIALAQERGYRAAVIFAEQVLAQVASARDDQRGAGEHFNRALQLARELRTAYPYVRALSAYAGAVEAAALRRDQPVPASVQQMRAEIAEQLAFMRGLTPVAPSPANGAQQEGAGSTGIGRVPLAT